MNLLTKLGQHTESPIGGFKEFVDRARVKLTYTPPRIGRKKFAADARDERYPTDDNMSIKTEAAKSVTSIPNPIDPHPQPMEQSVSQQPVNVSQLTSSVGTAFSQFPSRSQLSDVQSAQQSSQSRPKAQDNRESPTSRPGNSTIIKVRRNQFQQHKREPSNCALETTNDRIDDDVLSAWWFLGSRSEGSMEITPQKKQSNEPKLSATNLSNVQTINNVENITIIETANESESSKQSDVGSVTPWVSRTFSSDRTHSFRPMAEHSSSTRRLEMSRMSSRKPSDMKDNTKPTHTSVSFMPHQQSFTQQKLKGGDYTRKELDRRREWLIGLGGTVNYDQPYGGDNDSVVSYHLYPQLSFREDPNKSPDWDPSMVPRAKKIPTFDDWTPQDSSYGAAVPICGWIPKRIRKLIEIVFFVVVAALIIFAVVKLGIILIGGNEGQSSGTGEDYFGIDDDHYISNNAQDDVDDGSSSDVQDRLRRR